MKMYICKLCLVIVQKPIIAFFEDSPPLQQDFAFYPGVGFTLRPLYPHYFFAPPPYMHAPHAICSACINFSFIFNDRFSKAILGST